MSRLVLGALLFLPLYAPAVTPVGVFVQGPKLVAANTVGGALQGGAVALSADGSTALVGGSWDDSLRGAAWIFTRASGAWTEGQKLVGANGSADARQGVAVALSADGSTALVGGFQDAGGAGAAWVFTRTNGVFTQQGAKLVGTGAVGAALQGISVALSADGSTALVGGSNDGSGTGAVWVFTRTNGIWSQQGGKLVGTGGAGISNQGSAVALSADGSTGVVGAAGDASALGAVWVFTRTAGVWTQQGPKLTGNDAVGAVVYQGGAVDVDAAGGTLIFGGVGDASFTGAAWLFARSAGVWSQQLPKLVGLPATVSGQQGAGVALSGDGNTAVVGAPQGADGGGAWTFTKSSGVWGQRGPKYTGTGAYGTTQLQGTAVAISNDGSTALVGGPYDDLDGNVGAAWVLDRKAVKGDANGDGSVNVSDVFHLINYLFAGGPAPH